MKLFHWFKNQKGAFGLVDPTHIARVNLATGWIYGSAQTSWGVFIALPGQVTAPSLQYLEDRVHKRVLGYFSGKGFCVVRYVPPDQCYDRENPIIDGGPQVVNVTRQIETFGANSAQVVNAHKPVDTYDYGEPQAAAPFALEAQTK